MQAPEPRHLACAIASLGSGGAERVMAVLVRAWARDRRVTIFTLDDGTVPPFHEVPPGVEHRPLALASSSDSLARAIRANWYRVARLRAAIRDASPDVVLSFGDQVNVLTLLACRPLGLPVIVSERVDPRLHDPGRPWRALRRLTYPRAAAVVVQTERTREYLATRVTAPLVVIPNPVLPAPSRDEPGEPLVVGMGRLVPQKGFDILLRAFADAAPQLPGWRLIIAGEGPERRTLEALTEELGLTHTVALPGLVRDNYGLLGRTGIFVLASRFEGFPNALAEAMACGRAVVATDCLTGPRELTLDGTAGLLVPVDDVAALSAALVRLGGDAEMRRRLGQAAVAAMTAHGLPEVLRKWQDLFRKVTSSTKTGPRR